MKFMIETGSESHTTSGQSCQAKFAGGERDGQPLFTAKSAIVSQEWLKRDKHTTLVSTVFELPEGTEILVDYRSNQSDPEKFILRLDASQDVAEYEIGTCNLRTYAM